MTVEQLAALGAVLALVVALVVIGVQQVLIGKQSGVYHNKKGQI